MSNEIAEIPKHKLPVLADLISDKELAFQQDDLNLILNSPVPKAWVKTHPMVKIKDAQGNSIALPYLPVLKVKYLLKRIFGTYQWQIKNVGQILNSVYVTGTLTVKNPITGEYESQDGCGATSIQMEAGATQGDLSKIKANAIQIGLPSAESYAFKNAAEKFGKIFGADIYDIDGAGYNQVFSEEVRAQTRKDNADKMKDVYAK